MMNEGDALCSSVSSVVNEFLNYMRTQRSTGKIVPADECVRRYVSDLAREIDRSFEITVATTFRASPGSFR